MDILRFITAGSVDDEKSTLIGRLLYDSKSILVDQLEALEKQSKNKNADGIDLAILTDGLRAEREQGITIDVAYRYFSTPKRKFIIADAPGHVQYTRNMITGASNSQLIIILIDARQGVIEQTRRHSIIASLLKMKHVVVAVNKMDLVDYSEEVYNKIKEDYRKVAENLGLKNIAFFPISAFNGDNIVEKSAKMPWFEGEPLLSFLENVEVRNDVDYENARFQVQYVIRPQTDELHDYRGYAGQIISGTYKKGDKITILPENIETTISKVETGGTEVEEVFALQPAQGHRHRDAGGGPDCGRALDVRRWAGQRSGDRDRPPACGERRRHDLCADRRDGGPDGRNALFPRMAEDRRRVVPSDRYDTSVFHFVLREGWRG